MFVNDSESIKKIRKNVFIAGYKGGMAHLASSFSSVELIYSLYIKGVMKHDPKNPQMTDRDKFILSKGHAGLALYAVLTEAGYLSEKEFFTYLKPNCHIGGEPNMRDLPGIEASTGSLGHGLSIGLGHALAQKIDGNGASTYVLIGDGESQEGSIWEAALSASALGVDNLIAILDCNGIQKSDFVQKIAGSTNWVEKWKAFGWNVLELDGHDVTAIVKCFTNIDRNGKPTIVIANTIKGKGVSIMENNPVWHFKLPNKKEKKIFMEELGITEDELEG